MLVGLSYIRLVLDSEQIKESEQIKYFNIEFATRFMNFNACSSRGYSVSKLGREIHKLLPNALKTPPQRTEALTLDSCNAVHNGIFMKINLTLKNICDKLFRKNLITGDEEKWIEEDNAQMNENVTGFLHNTSNCTWVQAQLNNNYYVSMKERSFPIAYAINLDKYPYQIFRLLKVIYRSHNVYCLHYDFKSDIATKKIFFNIASCMDNVIIPRKIEDVYWGWYTLEEAYANCFSDLILARENYPWKYVITLCGKELPLRTNAEIVSLLEPLKGTSSIEVLGHSGTDEFKYKYRSTLNKVTGWVTYKDIPLDPIPYNLKVYKSWAYVALSFQFVEYYLCSETGITMREFMKDVRIPEENIYAMLFMKPGVPGGYDPKQKDNIFPVTSYIWLYGFHKLFYRSVCSGWNIHNICMVGIGDLYRLSYKPGIKSRWIDRYNRPSKIHSGGNDYGGSKDRGPLFHNRYCMKRDHVVIDCMESELRWRNQLEFNRDCPSSM